LYTWPDRSTRWRRTGTVSRHFPTKQAVVEAVVLSRVDKLAELGRRLLDDDDAGEAFFGFFAAIARRKALPTRPLSNPWRR
jgi:AcrR family transcriptional regulator